MNDLKFGDICIADLSRSLDYPGRSFTPLVFLETEDADTGTPVYIFCRIGEKPRTRNHGPYVEVGKHPFLRSGCAVYPARTVSFSDESALIRIAGSIDDEARHRIRVLMDTDRKKRSRAAVMSLCPECKKMFMRDEGTVVKRLDPFSERKHCCDLCLSGSGYTYIVYKRKDVRRKGRRHAGRGKKG